MPDSPHAMILCDLDHFQRIDDTFGHQVDDLVIQGFGELLRKHAPKPAIVGRVGGQEFAIFIPLTDPDMAVLFAQALSFATATMEKLPHDLSVTASFGVSQLSTAGSLNDAYRTADMALYQAKNEGRNRVRQAS